MRIHHRRRGGYQKKEELVNYLVNDQIKSPEVSVIDENGAFLGPMTVEKALATAVERGYDLVEVSPKANPPVCKLLDYGQFKYHKEKEIKAQKAHAKKVDVKGIRLSVKMGQGDFDTRINQGKGFLADGHKLNIEIRLRGREKEHGDIARKKIQEYLAELTKEYELFIEQQITRTGGNVTAIVGRKS
ncbi:translation initiation factor IF-3 [Candidatus Uhrbacteria bacterium]|nr:MAG: translation initiation factor IF-3 [Candidatus Uhrbacteria bacterium]